MKTKKTPKLRDGGLRRNLAVPSRGYYLYRACYGVDTLCRREGYRSMTPVSPMILVHVKNKKKTLPGECRSQYPVKE